MTLLYATVRHTGTLDTARLFGLRLWPLEDRDRAPNGAILSAHLDDEHMTTIMAHEGPVVTLARPYADVEASWRRRGESMRELDAQMANYHRLLTRNPYVVTLGWR